jgi:glycosyltransferase involved in cell wall biosynthesis
VRNGVDTDLLFPQDRQAARRNLHLPLHGRIVLCIGNIVLIKGQDLLLEAFRSIATNDDYLIFVGDGEMRSVLSSRAREFSGQMGQRILFVGSQPHDAIPRWMAAADLLCLPSRNEGLPNVVLEAIACGRPVVATRVGGVEEVMTSSVVGTMVPPEDIAELGRALRNALDRDWDAAAIRREAERFSWGDTVRQCFDVWGRILARRNEGRQ